MYQTHVSLSFTNDIKQKLFFRPLIFLEANIMLSEWDETSVLFEPDTAQPVVLFVLR